MEKIKQMARLKKSLLMKKIDQAMKEAGEAAREEHRRYKRPLIVWYNGRIHRVRA